MMIGVFGPGMERMQVECPLSHLLRRLGRLVLLNQFEMRVLSRLYRACKANQSNRLRKAWEVNQFSCLYKVMEVTQSNN
jgi:hypothetical protein